MTFGPLHFNPTQAIHYFVLCFVSILGVIQLSAARNNRRDLLWFDARTSLLIGSLTIPASLGWFFLTDEEIFIPGLAGGEIIAIFSLAFITAVPCARAVSFLLTRARVSATPPKAARVKEPSV